MKTEEDEAFDEIARKQGHWGGGFQAKRAMAADKLHWSDCAVHNGPAYPSGPCDCGAAQEPPSEWAGIKAVLDEYGLQAIDFVADFKAALAQPAQEPVAWTLLLTGEHHGIIGEAGEKFIGAPKCYQRVNVYTTPPKREWVGLTDEEREGIAKDYSLIGYKSPFKEIEAKLKEKNT